MPHRGIFILLACVALWACGPSQPAAPAPEAPATEDAAPAPVADPAPLADPAPVPSPAPAADDEEGIAAGWIPPEEVDVDALLEEWRAYAATEDAELYDVLREHGVRMKFMGHALVNAGPEGWAPLLAHLADPDATPAARYFALYTLEDWILPTMLPDLLPLVDEANDPLTRSYGAYLIGRAGTEEAIPVLEELAQSDEQQIRFGGQLGLARLDQPAYIDQLLSAFYSGEATTEERTTFAIVMAEKMDPIHTDFYLDVARDPAILKPAREVVLQALGMIADPSTLPDLREIAADPALEDQQGAVENAIMGIELVNAGGVAPFPAIQ